MYNNIVSPQGTLAIAAGQRSALEIVPTRMVCLDVTVRATVGIATAAITAIRNRGSGFALIDRFILDESGTERVAMNGRVVRMLAEAYAPSALSSRRLTLTAVGTYQLEEHARIYFQYPWALDPSETPMIPSGARRLYVAVIGAPSLSGALVTESGTSVTTVTGVTMTVAQVFDRIISEPTPPIYVPSIRDFTTTVAGASGALPVRLDISNAVRTLVLSQETTSVGEVSDILQTIRFRGDFLELIGPTPMSWDDFVLRMEHEMGGAVVASNRSHAVLNFQRDGKLSKLLEPTQDAGLRFEFGVAASASAGASQIRATLVEMLRVPGVVARDTPFATRS